MGRFIILALLIAGVVKLTERVAEVLKLQVDWFWFVTGLIAAAIVGGVYFWLTNWWGDVRRPTRFQSVTHTTTQTPNQIGCESLVALIGGILIIAVVGFLLYNFLFPQ